MPNTTRGVGLFTAENIVAVIRAIPESDGTYRDAARKAEQYGGNVQYHTISNWVSHGRADIEAGQPSTAYARFTKRYRELIDEHCGPDTNRNREFDRALEILERTCECGTTRCCYLTGSWAIPARTAKTWTHGNGAGDAGRDGNRWNGPGSHQPRLESLIIHHRFHTQITPAATHSSDP